MRMSRLVALVTLAFSSAIFTEAATAAWTELPACGGGVTSDCVLSVTANSTDVPYPTSDVVGDGPYDVYIATYMRGGGKFYWYQINGDVATMSTTDVFTIKIATGSTFPAQVFARGQDVEVDRDTAAAGHTIKLQMRPIRAAYNACDGSGACASQAVDLDPAALSGTVDDLGYYTDPDDAAATRGFELATNADFVSTPLQLDWATNTILLDVANAHFEPDGTTPFIGQAEFRLPNAMLQRFYNVDDPSTLTPAAFSVRGPGGAASTAVTVGPGSVHVTIDGITFSKRTLRIQGKTQPLRPRNLSAVRRSATSGTIRSTGSRRRGSKVRGYQVVCRPGSGANVRAETTRRDALPIRVTRLAPGKRYVCTVRAKSRAGLGVPGRVVMPRRPA
jgi:hypothetical protein